MAVHQFVVRLSAPTGLPEDVFENVLYFNNGGIDSPEDTANGILDAYDAFNWGAYVNSAEVRWYETSGGQPLGSVVRSGFSWDGSPGPTETACCLSYAAVDDPGASTPRRRGRVFIGPLSAGAQGELRPGAYSTSGRLSRASARPRRRPG